MYIGLDLLRLGKDLSGFTVGHGKSRYLASSEKLDFSFFLHVFLPSTFFPQLFRCLAGSGTKFVTNCQ